MPSRDTIEAANTVMLFSAIPIQILLLSTLYHYRKKDFFKPPFFKLLFSVTVNDLSVCAVVAPLNIWVIMGAYNKYPHMLGTLSSAVGASCFASCVVGMAAIALNRIVNIVWLTKASLLWTNRTTRLAIILQWLLALAVAAGYLHPDTHLVFNENRELIQSAPNSTIALVHTVYGISIYLCCVLIVVVCYAACIVKLLHYKITNANIVGNDLSAEIKLFFQGFTLSSCMIVQFTGYIFFVFACGFQYCSVVHFILSSTALMANFYSTAPLALLMSAELRNHAKMMLKKQQQVAPARNKRQKNDH